MSRNHIPVLLEETIKIFSPDKKVILDATFGMGGHSHAFLEAGAKTLHAMDVDPICLEPASHMMEKFSNRFFFQQDRYSQMGKYWSDHAFDAILFDLGVSSPQLDCPERGFSFHHNGPLDMRMGQNGITASDILQSYGASDLAEIFWNYGQEPFSRAIARAIVAKRMQTPFIYTQDLAKLLCGFYPGHRKKHPATRVFQALRICVNREFEEIEQGLHAAYSKLKSGGILGVISFHSLEDRIVKQFLKTKSSNNSRYIPDMPHQEPKFSASFWCAPDAQACSQNPRARSAKLRWGIKV
jgi:16S rRNA (cytosine1402-N4)-methyltransferase